MTDKDNKLAGETLTVYNHLAIDRRMAFWSPNGLGASTFPAQTYVDMCLEPVLLNYVPVEVIGMFERAKAIMSYGIYHYPLFTAAEDSIFRMKEAALYHFVTRHGYNDNKGYSSFAGMLDYCNKHALLNELHLSRWHTARNMRNMVSHQKENKMQHPNGAITSLHRAKEMIEALFVYGPPNY